MSALGKNISAEIGALYAAASTAVTAGGSGDATEVTGVTINTASLQTAPAIYGKDFNSIAFVIAGTTTLADTKALTVTALIEDSANGSSWSTLVASSTIVSITASGATTTGFTGKVGVDLTAARQYVRVKFTPNLTATGTDTATVFGVAVLGGSSERPVV
jgi:hypothetical protein